ncbi:hypothetical protein G6737_01030 [Polynucleobacter paneuropaeus]|jgi:hypothetical protein|nr:hypothetical protein [Polynucleobacter paneuropaeus]MBT8521124.1 hypothetical protein [Polynucleobacter paneuropaeus]MBT8538578.1 hypothetical protein [Polynucleobacter paneuropaeus]RAZ47723.1 hypothetical protein DP175_05700 [Polynucleobacter paneuropaeus]
MNKHYKLFGITPTEPTFIMQVLIEQEFHEEKARIKQELIKVVQIQATSEVVETKNGPEANTRIDYLTGNGIFYNDELSGLGTAADEDELTYIELNFVTTMGSNTASLIIPKKSYPAEQSQKSQYLNSIIDHLAPERYSVEVDKDAIMDFLLGVFSKMAGNAKYLNSLEASK